MVANFDGLQQRTRDRVRLGLVLTGLMVFLTIFDGHHISSIPFLRTMSAVVGVGLMFWWIFKRLPSFRLVAGPQLWAVIFILVTGLVHFGKAFDVGAHHFLHYMQWFQLLVLYLIVHDLARDRRAFTYIWMVLVFTTVFMALVATLNVPFLSSERHGRGGFDGVNLNRQAFWYTIGLVSILWLLIERFGRAVLIERGILIASAAVLLLAILQTGSRGGFIGMVVGISALITLSLRKRSISAYVLFIPPFLGAVVLLVMHNNAVLRRLMAAAEGDDDGARPMIWEAALEMIQANLWIGQGANYQTDLGMAIGWGAINTHQAYLQLLLAFGVIGLAIWIGLVTNTGWRCWKLRTSPVGALFLSLIIASLCYGMAADLGSNRFFWLLLALASRVNVCTSILRTESRSLREDLGLPPRRMKSKKKLVYPKSGST